MDEFIPYAKSANIHDALSQGFKGGYTYFINWEMITNKKNNALKDSRKEKIFLKELQKHIGNNFLYHNY